MKDEIKEILDYLGNDKNYNCDCNDGSYYLELPYRKTHKLKDYITNLQEENEFLKLNNPEMNMEHFRIIKENKRKIDNLREENHRLKKLCDKYEEEHSTTFEYWKNQLETNKHPTLLKGEDKKVNMERNKDLKWYAFCQDINSNKLVYTNVLSQDLVEDILKRVKNKARHIGCYNELKEAIKSYLMWRYWRKSEYEVIVSNWSGRKMEEKIDIWYQLEPNLDRITEYINRELRLDFDKGE